MICAPKKFSNISLSNVGEKKNTYLRVPAGVVTLGGWHSDLVLGELPSGGLVGDGVLGEDAARIVVAAGAFAGEAAAAGGGAGVLTLGGFAVAWSVHVGYIASLTVDPHEWSTQIED